MNSTKTIVFDYDGTLHETLRVYAPAFRTAYDYLVEQGAAPKRQFQDAALGKWLGCTALEMWQSFMPELDPALRDHASMLVGQQMMRLTREGRGRLYAGVHDTLTTLKARGNRLVILSNCKDVYMNVQRESYGLDAVIDDYFCAESYDFIPKTQIFPEIAAKYPGSYTVVGDRRHDIDIGPACGVPTVACTYGYGSPEELASATHHIQSITELPTLLG